MKKRMAGIVVSAGRLPAESQVLQTWDKWTDRLHLSGGVAPGNTAVIIQIHPLHLLRQTQIYFRIK